MEAELVHFTGPCDALCELTVALVQYARKNDQLSACLLRPHIYWDNLPRQISTMLPFSLLHVSRLFSIVEPPCSNHPQQQKLYCP